jgi:hypothetical protein
VVLDGLRILATASKECFLSARIVLEIALVIIEDVARRNALQVGHILPKKSLTSAGLTLARLLFMFWAS